jgi:NadR type nicotinamide-nucleotide adenylyltransferase
LAEDRDRRVGSDGVVRVVVTGSESTGKTELARALAAHYRTAWAAEYVRDYMDAKGTALDASDVEAIARGQLAREDDAVARAERLVILDTDLLSTVIYARHYYADFPIWIEHAAYERVGHLYLLLDIDVPWTADAQRDRGDRRDEMHALFRDALAAAGARTVLIRGDWEERRRRAIEAIDAFLA